jgi:hypothetical protein
VEAQAQASSVWVRMGAPSAAPARARREESEDLSWEPGTGEARRRGWWSYGRVVAAASIRGVHGVRRGPRPPWQANFFEIFFSFPMFKPNLLSANS